MNKDKIKVAAPYLGLPFVVIGLILFQAGHIDTFFIFQNILLAIFGYFAAVIDIKSNIIPNKLVLAMLAVWVIIVIPRLFADIENTLGIITNAGLGFAVGGGLFLLVYIVSKKGLGGGDVKFMAAAGLYLGLGGVLPAMFLGTLFTGVVGLILILLKKIDRKGKIPLAPFLYIGILITLFIM